MIRFLSEAGPLIMPIILLTLVIGVLALWNALSLLFRRNGSAEHRRQSINAVLFWGSVAAILGFLGQWMGIHKMTRYIHEQGIVSPEAVAYGISESLLTPVAGMAVLVAAAFLWFFLRLGLWSHERHP
ncbi:MAG: MotA/TolQ/ExbB proton channel family protein [Thermoanaerobaculia bacterium]